MYSKTLHLTNDKNGPNVNATTKSNNKKQKSEINVIFYYFIEKANIDKHTLDKLKQDSQCVCVVCAVEKDTHTKKYIHLFDRGDTKIQLVIDKNNKRAWH